MSPADRRLRWLEYSRPFGLVGGKDSDICDNPFAVQLVFRGKVVPYLASLISAVKASRR